MTPLITCTKKQIVYYVMEEQNLIFVLDETLVIFMEIGFVDVKFRRTISTNNQKTAIND